MEKRYIFKFKYQTLKWGIKDDVTKEIYNVKRPAVMVLLKGKKGVELIEPFLLDSGADNSFIKYDLAELLELELSEKTSKVKTAGKETNVYETHINMGLIQRNGYYELGKKVPCFVFLKGKVDVPNVMGRTPLFDKFRIVFEQYNDTVRLTSIENIIRRKTKRKR